MINQSARGRSTDIDKRIGARLRLLRISRDMTQETLGEALGLTFQQIQKYEKGTNAIASSRIPQICQVLKIKPNDLFSTTGIAFDSEPVLTGNFALSTSVRIEKLGTRPRRAMLAFLSLVEGMKDGATK